MEISDTVGNLEEEICLPQDSLLSGVSILFEDASYEDENQVSGTFFTAAPTVSNRVGCSFVVSPGP